jgi:hypothetical protein
MEKYQSTEQGAEVSRSTQVELNDSGGPGLYEPPTLSVLGSVHERTQLTQVSDEGPI